MAKSQDLRPALSDKRLVLTLRGKAKSSERLHFRPVCGPAETKSGSTLPVEMTAYGPAGLGLDLERDFSSALISCRASSVRCSGVSCAC